MSLKSTATHSAAPTIPAALLHHFTLTTAAVTTNHQQVAPTDQESHRPTSQRSAAGSSEGREQETLQRLQSRRFNVGCKFPVVDLHVDV